ncbi:MAG: hypothetical protein JRN66_04230 [Nitrososphaerota archaeon]|nr:hypothetical protein [Nitrososphaerota archaeon]
MAKKTKQSPLYAVAINKAQLEAVMATLHDPRTARGKSEATGPRCQRQKRDT